MCQQLIDLNLFLSLSFFFTLVSSFFLPRCTNACCSCNPLHIANSEESPSYWQAYGGRSCCCLTKSIIRSGRWWRRQWLMEYHPRFDFLFKGTVRTYVRMAGVCSHSLSIYDKMKVPTISIAAPSLTYQPPLFIGLLFDRWLIRLNLFFFFFVVVVAYPIWKDKRTLRIFAYRLHF